MAMCNKYDNLIWLSWAKGKLARDVAVEMESHSESCSDCRKQLEFSRKIASIMELEPPAPPESWTSEAAAKFESFKPSQESSNIFGNLVFDSYLHDREAVRSPRRETRHLVFDLPQFELDVALQFSGRQLNVMMGHLAMKEADTGAAPDVSLQLNVAARTYFAKPNELGEFLFAVETQLTGEPLELRCTFEEGPCAIVLIPC